MKTGWLSLIVTFTLAGQVTYDRLRQADSEPGNWLSYSGNYSSHRYSRLSQITAGNVKRLKPVWIYQTAPGKVETTPLVIDGVMYITEPPSNVTALDTRTGRPLWKYQRTVPKDLRICCGQVNRGVAALDDLVWVGTIDAHLIALDAKTGQVRWDTVVADYKTGNSLTAAPLAVKDKIIIGMAGGEFGVRGFVDAYEAATGKRAWRFWTVPVAGERGSETWAGESWKTGSATTWVTGSYDPAQNLVLWGTGNPGPDWNEEVRGGDNLYSDCLLALDADTGELKWHFQFTPHDGHDWDSTEVPVLIDGVVRGENRKLILFANRNGFYYTLDRQSGKFLAGRQLVRQTWAKGLDDDGRPVRIPNMYPSVEGKLVYPSVPGATNWFSPSYSARTGLFYVAVREEGGVYYMGDADYKPGVIFNGGGFRGVPGEEPWGAIRALKPGTGEVEWEFKLHSPPWAGVLSTAGGLVFGGTNEGDFFALDGASGKSLWRFQAGGAVTSNPISYLSEGKQHVAIAAGNAILVFALTD
ncbi:MAG: PQQ-dependent dehydrogenase, methanol/ethanol family [Acidobacteria bacterium]|nr:MAG: PQQ-dependent dehydrogenase, methanol/ethanol family [Acidobacteriota bacterium]